MNPGVKELFEEFFIHAYCKVFYQVIEPYIRHKNKKILGAEDDTFLGERTRIKYKLQYAN